MKVLMITTEWPTYDQPHRVPFLKRQVELLQSRGVEIHLFHFIGRKNPINYFNAYLQIRKLIKKGKFHVVHAQWGQSALPALGSKLPLVVTFRGSDLYGITNSDGSYAWRGKVLQAVSRWVARSADHIILVAEKLRSKLPVLPGKSVSIIPSGINLNLFKPIPKAECRLRLGLPVDKKFVLFGGDPERSDKRFYLAQQAMEIIANTSNAELLIVKSASPDEMPVYLNAADVVLLTSKHEGSPNIIKEALSCNRPVVSVDVGDVRERLANLSGCWLVADSPNAIAEALAKALNSTEPFESRSSILDLDEDSMTDKVIAVYDKVLA